MQMLYDVIATVGPAIAGVAFFAMLLLERDADTRVRHTEWDAELRKWRLTLPCGTVLEAENKADLEAALERLEQEGRL